MSKKPEHKYISKEMAQFYHALGTFNANMIGQIIRDPGSIKDVTDFMVIHCTVHDAECGANYVYDHRDNACIRLVEPRDGEA